MTPANEFAVKCAALHYFRYDLTACDTSWLPELIRRIGIGELVLSEATPAAPEIQLRAVQDSRCDYLMYEGHACNKCGRQHDGRSSNEAY